MALENLISISFSEAELTQLDQAITSIETILQGKTINLDAEQRQQYGSIAEQNKLFVNKAKSYMEQYPQFVPTFLDKAEYDRDYAARQQLESRMQRLSSVTEQLLDTKTLLDFDNYHNSLTFYRNMKYLSRENMPGTNVIYDDMKQFFVSSSIASPNEDNKAGS
ncbi:hypothetical protein JI747_009955 [Chryseobacterium sp. RG1]|uniref:LemA protein n=1 Tax=Chryseobacterium tagetis TaxID=2801334 RepID=A0ABS8A457_9FLAO|nr:hypothetical protein [Chryseobacterium tagetis]MCA6067501.1 hypothetical protein [Chryseobacterium tagetis]